MNKMMILGIILVATGVTLVFFGRLPADSRNEEGVRVNTAISSAQPIVTASGGGGFQGLISTSGGPGIDYQVYSGGGGGNGGYVESFSLKRDNLGTWSVLEWNYIQSSFSGTLEECLDYIESRFEPTL